MKVASIGLLLLLSASVPAQDKLTLKEETPYFPLQEGNTWTYRLIGGKEEREVVMKVTGLEKRGDEVAARVQTLRGKDLIATELFTVRKDGVYRLEYGGAKVEPPLRLLELPIKDRSNWEIKSKVGDRELTGRYVLGEEKKLKIDAKIGGKDVKEIDAVTVTSKDIKVEGQDMTTTYWFAEKVGLVKHVVDIGGRKVTLELKSFEEGKK